MQKIALKGMQFHSFHGYYAEERSVGNTYEVDVIATKDLKLAEMNDNLDKTINYESIYRVCKEEMGTAQRLIETVASRILQRLGDEVDPKAKYTVVIRKKNPLLGGLVDHAMIEISS